MKIKYKIFFILIALSALFFNVLTFKTKATETTIQLERSKLIQQIQTLQKEVQRLKFLISKLEIQKEISADSYLVVNLSDNSIILEKNIDKIWPIASITKLMSAAIALENIDLNQKIVLTEEMLKPIGYSPSLFLGLTVSAKNLLKASLIQSTNDAANSLTYFLEKRIFLNLMNQKAKDLEMANTFFYDAHGLDISNRSTVSDILKLISYISKNHPEILAITKDNNFWLPDNTGRMLKFKNVTNLYDVAEFIGGKAGYLPESKETLAALFDLKGKPVAVILLYSQNFKNDSLKILNWLKNNPAPLWL